MLRAIIIDDEPDCVKLLALQLKMYCPQVQVEAMCTSSEDALEQIKILQPQLVFLDIEMPVMNGFQLLERLEDVHFNLVFVTAYDQFAVRAFRFNALDYLLKPINGKDLQAAVQKAEQRHCPVKQQLALLKQQINTAGKNYPDKIALPFQNGVTFVDISTIQYCESDNNYTKFFTTDGKQFLVAKTLGDIQGILEETGFLRVHRQYLVNLQHVRKYVRSEGNYLELSNGKTIPVARNQKKKLMERFGWL